MELWIARDACGWLGLYKSKPVYEDIKSDWVGDFMGFIDMGLNTIFPEVTFENSPKKVELKLI